jgi:hypothetical protein
MTVFLSYSRDDADEVELLREDIEALRSPVWFDATTTGRNALRRSSGSPGDGLRSLRQVSRPRSWWRSCFRSDVDRHGH